ncbi:type II toxin-antitoxin system VapC family toxin [Thermosulfuriphilus ammonigenes]|uniref:Ribonuclease VapC n=1 Tax=Thermosulfuriphilus ammonigenes TaxID=1936021 RepID=A0A6G7PZ57_9BACT|nr:type II toxin-antitoxin system VapC family toxin [Thermosulfuriphilus ammonigenes]MBA2849041.1 putative nucleic acid-binding protein [Thermosulfuriphilus ammonigenes]QIJ72728.1 type II toxin-antitoxin system VapC family toxin [Thermosulfuriphilus ammonigenes]
MKQEFVLDASVTVAWALEDEGDLYSEKVLDALGEGRAWVPSIWPLEVANALLMAERRRRLTRAEVENFLSLLQELPIQVEGDTILRVWGEILLLAREEGLSVYDAAYLNLAMRLGLPLATLDQALQKAARNCGVEVF